jgi:hypothetical protein
MTRSPHTSIPDALEPVLDAALDTRIPVLIWGPPGVGKSATVQAWAARSGLRCWTVIASLREPSDFAGLPVVEGMHETAGKAVRSVAFAPPRFAVEAASAGGVIFLDELTTCPPAVQAALLRSVVDRAFGDLELDPEHVAIVAAANPAEDAAGGWDLAGPLANRFLHHHFELQPNRWAEDFPGYWGAPPRIGFGGRELDAPAWATARAVVAGFVRARPGLLLNLPEAASLRGQAWPSPRSWDYASRLLAKELGRGRRPTDALPLLAGCVGEGAAVEFAAWCSELDLPDPESLLANPQKYRHPLRGDHAYAILAAVAQAARGRLTPQRWQAAWQIMAAAADSGGADIAAVAVRDLVRARTPKLPLPIEELRAFYPLLETAGLLDTEAA